MLSGLAINNYRTLPPAFKSVGHLESNISNKKRMRLKKPIGFIYNVAEDLYRSYTCKDWMRYTRSRTELQEMLERLDRLKKHTQLREADQYPKPAHTRGKTYSQPYSQEQSSCYPHHFGEPLG